LTGEEKEHGRRRLLQVAHLPQKIRTSIKKKGHHQKEGPIMHRKEAHLIRTARHDLSAQHC